MFCSKCGKELQDDVMYCPSCGNKTGTTDTISSPQTPRVMLDPSEVVAHKDVSDSGKSFSGQGRNIGLILIIISIFIDLIGIISGFFVLTTVGTVLFIIGILIRMFCP